MPANSQPATDSLPLTLSRGGASFCHATKLSTVGLCGACGPPHGSSRPTGNQPEHIPGPTRQKCRSAQHGLASAKRLKGIEPSPGAWEATVLPLHHSRDLTQKTTFFHCIRYFSSLQGIPFNCIELHPISPRSGDKWRRSRSLHQCDQPLESRETKR